MEHPARSNFREEVFGSQPWVTVHHGWGSQGGGIKSQLIITIPSVEWRTSAQLTLSTQGDCIPCLPTLKTGSSSWTIFIQTTPLLPDIIPTAQHDLDNNLLKLSVKVILQCNHHKTCTTYSMTMDRWPTCSTTENLIYTMPITVICNNVVGSYLLKFLSPNFRKTGVFKNTIIKLPNRAVFWLI